MANGVIIPNSIKITKKSYTLSLNTDASSPLGAYNYLDITADFAAYGKVIGCYANDASGYPALATYVNNGAFELIGVTGKNTGNALVTVIYSSETITP